MPPAATPGGPGLGSLPPLGPFSVDAQPDTAESMKLDVETPRHESDGGGRAFIESASVIGHDGEPVAAARNDAGEPIFRARSSAPCSFGITR